MSASVPAVLALALLISPPSAARIRLRRLLPAGGPRGSSFGGPLRTLRSRLGPGKARRAPLLLPAMSGGCVAAWVVGVHGVAVVPQALAVGAAVGLVVRSARRRWQQRRKTSAETEPLRLAAGWDLLAAGMRAGLPVSVTLRAVSAEFAGSAAGLLREVSDLFALGADPVSAWEPALAHPDTAELARAARRTARTGSGMADVATDLACQARAAVAERAEVRSQRAAVWISAPLGLCFLPAFLCLGVLPVIAGMVQRVSGMW